MYEPAHETLVIITKKTNVASDQHVPVSLQTHFFLHTLSLEIDDSADKTLRLALSQIGALPAT